MNLFQPQQCDVYSLWLSRVVSADPPHVNPSLKIAAARNGGVPASPTVILWEGGVLIWEPSGEVRAVRENAESKAAKEFCDKHIRAVSSAAGVCQDPEKLKKIAEILGMELS